MTAAHQPWMDSPWFNKWLALARHVAVAWLCATSVSAANYYVSTTGSATNSGAIASPWPFQYGITNASNGDTVWVRSGTYGSGGATFFTANKDGVTIRNYANERAIVNGAIVANGANLIIRGLEIYNSAAVTRTNSSSGLPYGISLSGANSKVINCVIHDTGAPGIYMPTSATNAEVYGCVMWGIGLYQTDWIPSGTARGPIFYGQSNGDTRLIKDNIVAKSWTEGLKAYGEVASADGFTFEGNAAYLNAIDGYLIDTTANVVTNFTLINNHSYANAYDRVGESEVQRKNALISGNIFAAADTGYRQAIRVHGWTNVVFTNNLFVAIPAGGADTFVFDQFYATNAVQTWTVDANQYYGGTDLYGHWYNDTTPRYQWAPWQALGYDAAGGYTPSALPAANQTFLRVNAYEAGRANLIVWNWTGASSVSVSLAGIGLTEGQNYEVRDTQNWLGSAVMSGAYHAASPTISVPLTNTTITAILGTQTHFPINPNVHTPSVFNAFVIRPPMGKTVLQAPTVRAGKMRRK